MRLRGVLLILLIILCTSLVWAAGQESTHQQVLPIAALVTVALIAGEALALFGGTHVLKPPLGNPWISPKNEPFLVLDALSGAGLLYLALARPALAHSGAFYLFSTAALASHGYREWEYLADRPHPFAANRPLVVVNSVKLAASLLLLGAGALLMINVSLIH